MNLKSVLFVIILMVFGHRVVQAQERLIFEDDFEREEADNSKEEIGKGWSSNSKKRAKGNKQVDLNNSSMGSA